MIPDIVVLNQTGLDAAIFDPDVVALVVEVTSPSNAWADRLVKPDAYARAGIPHYLRVDLDRGGKELGATGRADLDLAALAIADRYPGR